MSAFRPAKANTVVISATTTAATTALVFESPRAVRPTVMVKSLAASADTAYLTFGPSGGITAAVAGTTGIPIMPGERIVLQLEGSDTHVSVDCPSSTATLYLTTGEGGD
jgi:hypothetical protein